ncbi:hypothetical protein HHI36_004453 [Cryptolaemus montrouzieri]|uniref:Uncharacterized protein n=1 Tax=Cryptolaemus montrouzieri TaxID=559131 RepID=A0ABD2NRL5_9CUCU
MARNKFKRLRDNWSEASMKIALTVVRSVRKPGEANTPTISGPSEENNDPNHSNDINASENLAFPPKEKEDPNENAAMDAGGN